eukprot:scaffold5019_cov60-Phaeocystis_antarctica.AAC.5
MVRLLFGGVVDCRDAWQLLRSVARSARRGVRLGVRCKLGGGGRGRQVRRRHGSCVRKLGLSGRGSDHRSLGDCGVGLGLHHGRGSRHCLVRGLNVVRVVRVIAIGKCGGRRGLLPRELRQVVVVLLLPMRRGRRLQYLHCGSVRAQLA